MRFITALFAKANTIQSLERDIVFIEREKVLAEAESARVTARLALVESDLAKERKAHNLALRRVADVVCRQAKLPQHFVDDVTERKEPEPDILTFEQDEKIRWLATEHRSFDIDGQGADEVPALDVYIDAIKNDPVKLAAALAL